MQDKISSITMYSLILVGMVLFVLSMMDSYDPILYGSYIYFGIGVLVALGGAIAGLISNPKGIKELGIGIVAMVVVLGLAYGMADGSDYVNYSNLDLSEGMSRFSGMLLYAIYIFSGLAILTVAYSWVSSLMK